MENERFFFAQDDSSHWYIVPESRRAEWVEWRNLDEDDERTWDAPEWAKRTGGGINQITFTDPR